jgi:hypothetical protein
MKNLFGILALEIALTFLATSKSASSSVPEQDVSIGVSQVYVPSTVDAFSEVVVTVTGVFPSACYRWYRAIPYWQENILRVETRALYRHEHCLLVMVPFRESISLGVLGVGNHLVRFDSQNGCQLDIEIVID